MIRRKILATAAACLAELPASAQEAATPNDHDIVTPNNDTPYSYAWVDLRAEPWVLTVPEIEEGRFCTSQWDDLWGYVLANVGSPKDGNDGTSVLLAAPGWEGELPEGLDRVIQGESQFLGSLTRTQAYSPDDMENVRAIQEQYELQPLSAWLGEEAPEPALRSSGWSGRRATRRHSDAGSTWQTCGLTSSRTSRMPSSMSNSPLSGSSGAWISTRGAVAREAGGHAGRDRRGARAADGVAEQHHRR
jgi:hypothetical protein